MFEILFVAHLSGVKSLDFLLCDTSGSGNAREFWDAVDIVSQQPPISAATISPRRVPIQSRQKSPYLPRYVYVLLLIIAILFSGCAAPQAFPASAPAAGTSGAAGAAGGRCPAPLGLQFVFLTYDEGSDSSSGPGTETTHDVDNYSVDTLDRLVVRLVREELAKLPQESRQ